MWAERMRSRDAKIESRRVKIEGRKRSATSSQYLRADIHLLFADRETRECPAQERGGKHHRPSDHAGGIKHRGQRRGGSWVIVKTRIRSSDEHRSFGGEGDTLLASVSRGVRHVEERPVEFFDSGSGRTGEDIDDDCETITDKINGRMLTFFSLQSSNFSLHR